MDFGVFTFNFSSLFAFFEQPIPLLFLRMFALGLWIPVVSVLLRQSVEMYADYVQDKKNKDWKFVLLAIDIPQMNIQTPKAVEQLFSHLAGVYNQPDLRGKFREGYKQKWFSFEIISIEGYIQFLIWTEQEYRDLVETAVYAQYPDAEITEVEDYTTAIPDTFPNTEYDVWSADFALAENAAFPIRTYEEFEHSISKDTVLKDPMGTMLESFSRIGHGEQLWLQILLKPIDSSWKEDVIQKIKEFIGEEPPKKKGLFSKLSDNFLITETVGLVQEAGRQISGSVFGADGGGEESPKSEDKNQLKYMTPGQIRLVEAMEKKIQKMGYKINMRAVYAARKEVFNSSRGVTALVGSVSQFNIPSANSIVIAKSTSHRKQEIADKKKKKYLEGYKKRKMNLEVPSFVFNIEELATLWHFPMSHVKTPLLQKAANKAAEPPAGLPVEYIIDEPISSEVDSGSRGEKKRVLTDSGEEISFDDEQYG